ncbi:MAG: hypothetical protein R3183_06440 [Oleiphilaceae bacterium]|nr:hypothetical protein [Oleiphilaceae bacterium]
MFKHIYLFGLLLALALPIQAKTTFTLANGEQLVDPTKPHGWRASQPAKAVARNYKLNYILKADGRAMAMINGQRVAEGDYVSGARVLSIRDTSVSLLVEGQRRTLHVAGSSGMKIRK